MKILSVLLFFIFVGCKHLAVKEFENPKIVTTLPDNCLLIDTLTTNQFFLFDGEYRRYAQQEAPSDTTHLIFKSIEKNKSNNKDNQTALISDSEVLTAKGDIKFEAFYFNCFQSFGVLANYFNEVKSDQFKLLCEIDKSNCNKVMLSAFNNENFLNLVNSTKASSFCYNYLDTCKKALKETYSSNDFFRIYFMNNLLCGAGDKPSCIWVSEFNKFREKLKIKCIAKDSTSCLGAAVLADFSGDAVLMSTFLKQGCGYSSSECCFYYNLNQEIKEQNRQRTYQHERISKRAYIEYIGKANSEIMSSIKKLISEKDWQ